MAKFKMNGEKVGEDKVIDLIDLYKKDYAERRKRKYPNFGDDDCMLVVKDGTSIVGLATVWAQRITICAVREGYEYDSILSAAREYFSRKGTNWGVYTTQV